MEKPCVKCGHSFLVEEFYVDRTHKDGRSNECNECWSKRNAENHRRNKSKNNARCRTYYGENREHLIDGARDRNMKNKDRIRAQRLKRDYGITKNDYDRMLKEQKECCAICGRHQSELRRSLSVDHNHETGKVRGLLCGLCNLILGNAKDSRTILESAIIYLEERNACHTP